MEKSWSPELSGLKMLGGVPLSQTLMLDQSVGARVMPAGSQKKRGGNEYWEPDFTDESSFPVLYDSVL